MFSGLNKIFDRNFIVGCVLPALAFMLASYGLLYVLNALPGWLKIDPDNPLQDSTFFALVTWVVALFLIPFNRMILRGLEGYWFSNWADPFVTSRQAKWQALKDQITALDTEKEDLERAGNQLSENRASERNRLKLQMIEDYPDQKPLVLATKFGNTVRAFEVYPRVMYNFESITGWSRLLAVVPKDFREIIDTARADTDFWMNLWVLNVVFFIEYLGVLIGKWAFPVPWPVPWGLPPSWSSCGWILRDVAGWLWEMLVWVACTRHALIVVPACYVVYRLVLWQARVAAQQWGEWVKAAFDVYMPDLLKKMGYGMPETRPEQLTLWGELSQAFTYEDKVALAEIEKYREKPSSETADAIGQALGMTVLAAHAAANPPAAAQAPPASTAPAPFTPAQPSQASQIKTMNRDVFETMYQGQAPWDIPGPQPAFVALEEAGAIRGSVLDIGCGTGENALYLAACGHEVWSIDFVPVAIERATAKARERGLNVHFQVGDALELERLGRTFDTVIDSGLFHVFSDEQRAVYVKGLASVVRPGGAFHMLCFSDREPPGEGPRRVTEEEIRDAFRDGWQVREVRESSFKTASYPGAPKFSPGGPQAWVASIVRPSGGVRA